MSDTEKDCSPTQTKKRYDGLCVHGRGLRAPCPDCTTDKFGHNDPWPQEAGDE